MERKIRGAKQFLLKAVANFLYDLGVASLHGAVTGCSQAALE
jgi:hypothetical protein